MQLRFSRTDGRIISAASSRALLLVPPRSYRNAGITPCPASTRRGLLPRTSARASLCTARLRQDGGGSADSSRVVRRPQDDNFPRCCFRTRVFGMFYGIPRQPPTLNSDCAFAVADPRELETGSRAFCSTLWARTLPVRAAATG